MTRLTWEEAREEAGASPHNLLGSAHYVVGHESSERRERQLRDEIGELLFEIESLTHEVTHWREAADRAPAA